MAAQQKTLKGGSIPISEGLKRQVRRSETRYSRKSEDYEEVFRDLMRYGVINPQKISSVDDFRNIVNHARKDGAKVISENLVEVLEHTMEYKEMIIERLRYGSVKLRSGSEARGLIGEDQKSYLYFDSRGKIRVRDLYTGRFTKKPEYYGLLGLSELL
jgi:hypothetical protein